MAALRVKHFSLWQLACTDTDPGKKLTHSLDVEHRHELIPKFAAELSKLGDRQVLQQPRDCRHRYQSLL